PPPPFPPPPPPPPTLLDSLNTGLLAGRSPSSDVSSSTLLTQALVSLNATAGELPKVVQQLEELLRRLVVLEAYFASSGRVVVLETSLVEHKRTVKAQFTNLVAFFDYLESASASVYRKLQESGNLPSDAALGVELEPEDEQQQQQQQHPRPSPAPAATTNRLVGQAAAANGIGAAYGGANGTTGTGGAFLANGAASTSQAARLPAPSNPTPPRASSTAATTEPGGPAPAAAERAAPSESEEGGFAGSKTRTRSTSPNSSRRTTRTSR
ncbi:hypothetical protein JCM8547_008145, partial [Rhodosporidiobolus lusitaniae]